MYKYKASIIMAVYNVEPFLREAIESIVKQDIGFQHIQLILVDDGATDGSGAICDEYGARYPENVLVIHKENGGVSSARNEGLKHVEGRYINVMDADDKLTLNTVREVCKFFEENEERVDLVALPMIFFDGQKGQHMLNYKFGKGSRVIDLDEEWQNPQLSMASAFVKASCMEGLAFDTRLAYAEDAQLVQKILSHKCALGVLKTAAYKYRRRTVGEQSAIQSSHTRVAWYLPCMHYFHGEILNFYRQKYERLPRFVQNTLMYDLQWRLRQPEIPEGVLSDEDKAEYRRLVVEMLQNIDDEVIMAQRNIFREHKFMICKLKHGGAPAPVIRDNNVVYAFPGSAVFKVGSVGESSVTFEFIKPQQGGVLVEGTLGALDYLSEDKQFFLRVNGELHECEVTIGEEKIAWEQPIMDRYHFKAFLPLDASKTNRIDMVLRTHGVNITLRRVSFGQFFPLTVKYDNAYAVRGQWVIRRSENGIRVDAASGVDCRALEKTFCKEVWDKSDKGGRKAVIARWMANFLRRFKKRQIWLISDRTSKAGDNGEALMRYMRKEHPEVRACFVLNKDCPDFGRMKKVGPVLARNSYFHKLLLIMSDYIISSHAEVEIYNPFRKYSEAYQDLLTDRPFVFLQHGVTKDDLSDWLGRRKKNLGGFITAANPEYQSIVEGNYDYTGEQVWLTGFPRFDRLYNDDKKIIAIMPTWRKYLMGKINKRTGEWSLVSDFENTQFFQFYNGLINDERLLKALKDKGYTLAFFPHPNLQPHMDHFTKNEAVKFMGNDMEYRDIFAQASLILSDFSSTVFDFVYLRKPVMYAHFDAEAFFAGEHSYTKGYFDYERDGFGEIEYDLEGTVDRIIEYVENGCQLKDKYRQRIDSFFAFGDQGNCQRVYEQLMAHKE